MYYSYIFVTYSVPTAATVHVHKVLLIMVIRCDLLMQMYKCKCSLSVSQTAQKLFVLD